MFYCFINDFKYFVYVEQDCLIHGEGIIEKAIDNMLNNSDPYTRYYDEQDVEMARINAAGQYGGIGAKTKIIDNKLFITEPYENAPADKAGIKAGDEITKINDITVDKNTIKEALFLLNGTPNSKVNIESQPLTVLRVSL